MITLNDPTAYLMVVSVQQVPAGWSVERYICNVMSRRTKNKVTPSDFEILTPRSGSPTYEEAYRHITELGVQSGFTVHVVSQEKAIIRTITSGLVQMTEDRYVRVLRFSHEASAKLKEFGDATAKSADSTQASKAN